MSRDIWRNGDVLSAAVLVALGVYIATEAGNWVYYSDDGPGPAFFPVWYGIAMVVLSLVLLVTTVVRLRQGGEQAAAEAPDWEGIRRALITWAAFAVCALLMKWLGFMIAFAMLAFFIITYVFRQPPVMAGVAAVATALGFYLVFPLALSVALPTGVFGF
ncbi:MAG: tripartite tricarboxylate transporter TctB family protein [Xanthobacteraceae bacterium]|nr:tripartite tricarboxylate transporter TctB family protein [Xanthobacteraceae bacterium]